MDLIIRNARLAGDASGAALSDIGVIDGRVETHIHLDKSRVIERCAPEPGRRAQAAARVAAVKPGFTSEDIYTRARTTLESCIAHGATRMRTNVEIDPPVGLTGFEAIMALAKDYAWAINLEICACPQEGLTNNPASDPLLVAALRQDTRLMNLTDYGIAVGNKADIVVLDATSPEQAVAEIGEPLDVFKQGRRTVTRLPVELHRPT